MRISYQKHLRLAGGETEPHSGWVPVCRSVEHLLGKTENSPQENDGRFLQWKNLINMLTILTSGSRFTAWSRSTWTTVYHALCYDRMVWEYGTIYLILKRPVYLYFQHTRMLSTSPWYLETWENSAHLKLGTISISCIWNNILNSNLDQNLNRNRTHKIKMSWFSFLV